MPTTITLKNVPDALYERLRLAAETHRRSLNSEAIVCLETVLIQTRVSVTDRLVRARELRAGLRKAEFKAGNIAALKRLGRP